MQISITEFIKPELIILVPVLYILGMFAKKTEFIADSLIPALLGVTGVIMAIIWVFASTDIDGYKAILMGLFIAVTQGVLCAGGSVYVNQLVVKQPNKGASIDEN